MNDREAIGMGALLFVAWLDTVAAAIGFNFRYLAEKPEAQARLRAVPAGVILAVEELLRAFPTVLMTRIAVTDTEFDNIFTKAGDRASCRRWSPTPIRPSSPIPTASIRNVRTTAM